MKHIDIHIHGGYGVNFNTSSYDDIKMFLKKLYERNIAAICPTLVGDNIKNLQERFELFYKLKNSQKQGESRILGLHLEGTFLNPKKPGIQDSSVFMAPEIENFKKLADGYYDIIKIVTYAPELDCGNKFAKYLEENNIRAHAGHTLAKNKGLASATTHHFNAMPNMTHRGDNLALDALFDDDLYCEIIADLKHVEKNMLKLFFTLKNNDKTQAAIASKLAAEIYDLEILKPNIENASNNTTRFLIMSTNNTIPENDGKKFITSLVFHVKSIPAALYKALGGFATNGINITKLESYLVGGKFVSAMFYAEIEAHPEEIAYQNALDELNFFADSVKILGTYPAHPYRDI